MSAPTVKMPDFLAALYGDNPPGGATVLSVFEPDYNEWFKVSDVNRIEQRALEMSTSRDVYYSVGIRGMSTWGYGRGLSTNVIAIPGLWAEFDCKGSYHKGHEDKNMPTKREVLDFLPQFGLKPSIILDSGGGLHVYWLFDRLWVFKSKDGWMQAQNLIKRFQTALIALFAARGWDLDNTSDLARVLRLPGTLNHHTYPNNPSPPKTVAAHTWELGTRHTGRVCGEAVERLAGLAGLARPTTNKALSNTPQGEWDGYTPADADLIFNNCPFMRHWKEAAGNLKEPEGLAGATIIARTKGGRALCHEWRAAHLGYNFEKTEKKIDHILKDMGPATCRRIRQDFPGNCGNCSHDTCANFSPIILGRENNQPSYLKHRWTDAGNANRLVDMYGEDLSWCDSLCWLVWDGTRWVEDRMRMIIARAKNVTTSMFAEAEDIITDDDTERLKEIDGKDDVDSVEAADGIKRRKKLKDDWLKWAKTSDSLPRLKAMVELSAPEVAVSPNAFDQDIMLFNTLNGTIDLSTGLMYEARRDDRITKVAPVLADHTAKCPTWLKFLDDILIDEVGLPDKELIEFVQRAVGYSLTGNVDDDVLLIMYGHGGNGKTVFIETVQALMGPYSKKAQHDFLLAKKQSGHPEVIAELRGVRALFASETDQGRNLSEALVKELTGGGQLSARFLNQKRFEFEQTQKVWLATNYKPVIKGQDDGIWRRIRLIPFLASFPVGDPRRDEHLGRKLSAELSGILNWAIEGCLNWQTAGLGIPDAVKKATSEYKNEMDTISQFLEARCVSGPRLEVSSKGLHEAFRRWAHDPEDQNINAKSFKARMEKRGAISKHTNKGTVWVGYKLQDETLFCQNAPSLADD